MARRRLEAIVLLLSATLACGAAADKTGEVQDRRVPGAGDEATPDAQLLAELEILRDLELLRDLDLLRKADEARDAPRPRTPREAEGKP